jgi:N-acylneuraminate cytidylyltransferase
MRRIGFIPVREGSKRVPHKNFKMIAGKRLFQWVVEAALGSNLDAVYLYTDDEKMRNFSYWMYRDTRLHLPNRPKSNAQDTSTTEQAMKDFTRQVEYDEIYLLQATSPMTTSEDINNAIRIMENHDSVVSVVRQKRFIWNEDAQPVNYDYRRRPISQVYKGFLVENGAIYGTTRAQFTTSGCRLGGNIGLVEMPENTYIEIDTPSDFVMTEALLERREDV